MEKKHSLIEDFKEGFQIGYHRGYLRTQYLAVKNGVITEEKAAENANLSVEEFREQVRLLEEKLK